MESGQINSFLLELLKAHHLEAHLDGDWIVVTGQAARWFGRVAQEWDHGHAFVVQLDIGLKLDDERFLIESFGGVGATRQEAVRDAFAGFLTNSFHVLLAAFGGQAIDKHIVRQTWEINGRIWQLFIGNIGMKGKGFEEYTVLDQAFESLQTLIQQQPLSPQPHWFRYFYAQHSHQMTACEVLQDNTPWAEAKEILAGLEWPKLAEYYSVRLFFVLISG